MEVTLDDSLPLNVLNAAKTSLRLSAVSPTRERIREFLKGPGVKELLKEAGSEEALRHELDTIMFSFLTLQKLDSLDASARSMILNSVEQLLPCESEHPSLDDKCGDSLGRLIGHRALPCEMLLEIEEDGGNDRTLVRFRTMEEWSEPDVSEDGQVVFRELQWLLHAEGLFDDDKGAAFEWKTERAIMHLHCNFERDSTTTPRIRVSIIRLHIDD